MGFTFFTPGLWTGEKALQQTTGALQISTRHEVFQHSEAAEQSQVLKSSGHALLRDLVRGHAGDVCAIEVHLPLARRVHACDAIEQSGFASTVGANQRGDFALVQRKRHIVQGGDAAKTHG